jgi:hypothetical protein
MQYQRTWSGTLRLALVGQDRVTGVHFPVLLRRDGHGHEIYRLMEPGLDR